MIKLHNKGQMIMTDIKTPAVTLTADQIKAREAALKAAQAAETSKLAGTTAAPQGNTPAVTAKPDDKGTVTTKPVTPQVAAMPGTAPLGIKPGDTAIKPGDTGKPVEATTLQPPTAKPASEAPKATTGTAAPQGKAETPAPQGGKATTNNPHTNPVKPATAGQGGTAGGKKGSGKADKAKPDTKGNATASDQPTVDTRGYDFSRVNKISRTVDGKVITLTPPSWAEIDLVACFKLKHSDKPLLTSRTANALQLAYGFTEQAYANAFNIYDVGYGLGPVTGSNGDHKHNTYQRAVDNGYISIGKGIAGGHNGGKPKTTHYAILTVSGLEWAFTKARPALDALPWVVKAAVAYATANGQKVPRAILEAYAAILPAKA